VKRLTGGGSRDMHEAVFRNMSLHRWLPVIDKVYPFEEARAAFDRIESSGHIGKVVIKTAG
jgi:NADPH:quinone reductase-like Zn-dependent oxidoreductase